MANLSLPVILTSQTRTSPGVILRSSATSIGMVVFTDRLPLLNRLTLLVFVIKDSMPEGVSREGYKHTYFGFCYVKSLWYLWREKSSKMRCMLSSPDLQHNEKPTPSPYNAPEPRRPCQISLQYQVGDGFSQESLWRLFSGRVPKTSQNHWGLCKLIGWLRNIDTL